MTGKPSLDLSRRPDAALQRELELVLIPKVLTFVVCSIA